MTQEVVILGGGPAGLALAWRLAERGVPVTVLERDATLGGQSLTVQRGAWRFDLGGHRFFTQYPDVHQAVQTLLGDELELVQRKSVIRLGQRWIRYPLEIGDLLRSMPLGTAARAGLDYVRSLVRTQLVGAQEESFRDWVVNRYGRTLYEIYFGTYSEKLWGCSPALLSADWAAQRIQLPSLWRVAKHLLGLKGEQPRSFLEGFHYPRHGIGTIADRMAERVLALGGRIICRAQVQRLELQQGRIRRVCFDEAGSPQSIPCRSVASTIPLPDLVRALDGAPPTVAGLRFRALRFLNLIIDRPRVSDNTWIYVPDPSVLFFRIQEPRNWRPQMAPEGKTSLILELACNMGDELWQADDELLLQRALPELEQLELLDRTQRRLVRDCFSTYMTHAYPVYDLGYRQRVEHALARVDAVTNLVTLGRQGLFRYNNMDHSLRMGFIAAQCWDDPARLAAAVRGVALEQSTFEASVARLPDEPPGEHHHPRTAP